MPLTPGVDRLSREQGPLWRNPNGVYKAQRALLANDPKTAFHILHQVAGLYDDQWCGNPKCPLHGSPNQGASTADLERAIERLKDPR